MKIIKITISLFMLFLFVGCDQPNENIEKVELPMSLLNNNNVDYLLYGLVTNGYGMNLQNSTKSFDQYYYFKNSNGIYVDANEVKVNNQISNEMPNSLMIPDDGIGDHEWDITGNSEVTSFSLDIQSVQEIEIFSPDPSSGVINQSVGFTLIYTVPSSADNVVLIIRENNGLTRSLIDNTLPFNEETTEQVIPITNNGSIFISPSILSQFDINKFIEFNIVAIKKAGAQVNSKDIKAVSASRAIINYELQQ